MQISFLKPNSVSPDGTYLQECGKECTGTDLQQVELKDILSACKTIEKAPGKHQNGSIFAYIDNTLGRKEGQKTDGVLFVEFDDLDKSDAEKIFESFDSLKYLCSGLYAVQYSSSYYMKEKGGLHFYFKTNRLDSEEYKNTNLWCCAILMQAIKKLTGIVTSTDNHMKSFAQRFFLYHSDYKINEDASEFDLNRYNNQKSKFFENYTFLEETKRRESIIEYDSIDKGKYCSGDSTERVCIDRNYFVGEFSGNDVRWRISRIASEIFGDGAKSWCDRFFYYERNKSIFTNVREDIPINNTVLQWLKEKNYIIDSNKEKWSMMRSEYINKYESEIFEFIKDKKTSIVAPTGSGKTTLINSLAEKLNAVVVVPFNVTNKLYDKFVVVSSDNNNNVSKDKPCVMVWDQAIIHWAEIKDRHIIVDESHTLFVDRDYRDAAIRLIDKLSEVDKVTLFTATPLNEEELIGCTDKMEFTKQRNEVRVRFVHTADNIDWRQYNYIKKAVREGWYDKIVLFDDISAKKVYERLICSLDINPNDIAYIRSETKESKDFKDLRDNELLTKKLTICTCIAFNGLNFKNVNENILVISRFTSNNTLYSELVQELGRLRNSNVKGLIYCEEGECDRVEEMRDKAEIKREAIQNNCPQCKLVKYDDDILDDSYYKVMIDIRDYKREHSNIEEVKERMNEYGYFRIKEEWEKKKDEPFKVRMDLAVKKKESNEFKKQFKNKSIQDYYNEDKKYSVDFYRLVNKLIYDIECKFTNDDIERVFELRKKDTLVDNILNDVIDAKNVAIMTANEWKQYDRTIKEISSKYVERDYDLINIKSKFNRMNELHNRFIDAGIIVEEDEWEKMDCDDIFQMFTRGLSYGRKVDVDKVNEVYFTYLEEKNKDMKIKNGEGGKIGGKKSKTNNIKKLKYDGKTYNSCKELGLAVGKSIQTISNWIKNGKVLEIK